MRAYHPSKSKNKNSNTSSTSMEQPDSLNNGHDYMSMDFILNAQSFDKMRKQSNKRKLFTDKNKHKFEPQAKKLKIRMEEERDKGLAKPIGKNNIGFKLLSKMGYKNGMIIGKNNIKNNNDMDICINDKNKQIVLKEPIKIKIRDKNSGVGVHEMKQRKVNALSKLIKMQKVRRDDLFQQSIRQKSQKRQFIKEIKESVIICENLDTQNNVNLNNPLWYKSKECKENNEDDDIDEFEGLSFKECKNKLENILFYLRDTHLYCFWCGIKYKDKDKMSESCLGDDKNLHDSLNDF